MCTQIARGRCCSQTCFMKIWQILVHFWKICHILKERLSSCINTTSSPVFGCLDSILSRTAVRTTVRKSMTMADLPLLDLTERNQIDQFWSLFWHVFMSVFSLVLITVCNLMESAEFYHSSSTQFNLSLIYAFQRVLENILVYRHTIWI